MAVEAPSTPSTRLTRGALRRMSSQDDAARIEEHAAFQNGLPTPKRRRFSSSTSDSTAGNETNADAESQATSTNAREVTTSTPAEATAPVPMKDSAQATPVVGTIATLTISQEELQHDGAPDGELFVVTVLKSAEFTPANNADDEVAVIQQIVSAMVADNDEANAELSWAKEYAAIDSLRRLAIHHQERLNEVLASRSVVADLVCPAAMNLRSAMVRNALLCIQDLVVATKQDGEKFYADIIPVLLQRAASEKQFIRELAHDVLTTCVETNPREVLLAELLRPSTVEKNSQIVNAAGLYTQKCIGKMDKSLLKTFVLTTHDSFVGEMSALLNCRVVECKTVTRRALQYVRRVLGEEEFTAKVKSKLEGTAQLDLLKASEEKKAAGAKSGLPKLSMRERMLQMKKQQAANGAAAGSAGSSDGVVVLVPDPTR